MKYTKKTKIEFVKDQMGLNRTWEIVKKTELFTELYNLLADEKNVLLFPVEKNGYGELCFYVDVKEKTFPDVLIRCKAEQVNHLYENNYQAIF